MSKLSDYADSWKGAKTFVSTSYGPPWGGIQGGGVTANGTNLHSSPHIFGVATDPSIPFGTKLYIQPNPFHTNEPFVVFDRGGAIKGNRIDFYDWRGRAKQLAWGKRTVKVAIAKGDIAGPSDRPDAHPGQGILKGVDLIGEFFSALVDPTTWLRVGKVLVGSGALALGLQIIGKQATPAEAQAAIKGLVKYVK